MKTSIEFTVLMTIKLGTHKSVNDLIQSLKEGGYHLSESQFGGGTQDAIKGVSLATSETEVTLHTATVKELTGDDDSTISDTDEAILSHGYALCPAEVGPQLRLQYPTQPQNEILIMAMKPLVVSGYQRLFRVCHDGGGLCLQTDAGQPYNRRNVRQHVVFMSCK